MQSCTKLADSCSSQMLAKQNLTNGRDCPSQTLQHPCSPGALLLSHLSYKSTYIMKLEQRTESGHTIVSKGVEGDIIELLHTVPWCTHSFLHSPSQLSSLVKQVFWSRTKLAIRGNCRMKQGCGAFIYLSQCSEHKECFSQSPSFGKGSPKLALYTKTRVLSKVVRTGTEMWKLEPAASCTRLDTG